MRSMHLHDTCLSSGKSQGRSQGQIEKSWKSSNATGSRRTEGDIKQTNFVNEVLGKLSSLIFQA